MDMKNSTDVTVRKVTLGVLAVGATFVLATSIMGAINKRSFVEEIGSWGQQEQQLEDDKATDETPEDESQTDDTQTDVEVDLVANVIRIG